MCLILSEVRSVRPSLVVWKGPFSLSSTWGSGNTEGTPCPPSLQIAPPTPSQLCFVHSRWHLVGTGIRSGCVFFSFSCPPPFISSWQGLEWGHSRDSALRYHNHHYYYRVVPVCGSARLLTHAPIYMRPLRLLARSYQQYMTKRPTLPICSIYAPRVSLPVHPTILRMLILLMLILLISAHDHHLAPPATGTMPPPKVMVAQYDLFFFIMAQPPAVGDAITLWGHFGHRMQNKNKKKPPLRPGLWTIPLMVTTRGRAGSLHHEPLLLRTRCCRFPSAACAWPVLPSFHPHPRLMAGSVHRVEVAGSRTRSHRDSIYLSSTLGHKS